jgi:hypothetical protein
LLDEQECAQLVRLDLACGRRALESGAYRSGLAYLEVAAELLTTQARSNDHHELYFEIEFERARASSLDGRRAEAKARYDALLEVASGTTQQLAVNTALVEYAMLVGDNELGYAACRRGLALLGVGFPERDEDAVAMFMAELEELDRGLGGRSPLALLALPMVDEAETDRTAELLHGLGSLSYRAGHPNVNGWITAYMVNLAMRTGNSKVSTVAYARLAMHLSGRGDYARAQEFGELALALCERHRDAGTTGRAYLAYLGHSAYHDHPLLDLLPSFDVAFHKCIEAGDHYFASHHINYPLHFRLTAGVPLAELMADIEGHMPFLRRSVPGVLPVYFLPNILTVCVLMDVPLARLGISHDHASHLASFAGNDHALGWYHASIIKLDYLLGKPCAPEEFERLLHLVETAIPGSLALHEARYYAASSLLDQLAAQTLDEQQAARALALIEVSRNDLARTASRCAANFRHKHLLLEAEFARVTGASLEQALSFYEQAIEAAHEFRCMDQEALAWWRFGEFWRLRGNKHMARVHIARAREIYEKWGAARMVRELDQRYGGGR